MLHRRRIRTSHARAGYPQALLSIRTLTGLFTLVALIRPACSYQSITSGPLNRCHLELTSQKQLDRVRELPHTIVKTNTTLLIWLRLI